MTVRVVDETDFGLGWIEAARLRRTGHALAVDGRVWLIDPIEPEDAEERVLELGEPAGVVQLLDRHDRDCERLASRLGITHHVVPRDLPETPFALLPVVRTRWWREVALWWPERRVLVCADALGTVPYFRVGSERAGVHPFLRFVPPRRLLGLGAEHLLVGHGEGLHGPGVAASVDDAIRHARRRLPRWIASLPRRFR